MAPQIYQDVFKALPLIVFFMVPTIGYVAPVLGWVCMHVCLRD
jgi:hypothetical protein